MFVNTLTLTLNSDTELSNSATQKLSNSETRCLGDLKNLSQSRKETQRNYLLLITHCSRLIAKITPNSSLLTPNSSLSIFFKKLLDKNIFKLDSRRVKMRISAIIPFKI